jgi:hypothetical protein
MLPQQSRITLPNPTPTDISDVAPNNSRLIYGLDRLPVFQYRAVEAAFGSESNTTNGFLPLLTPAFGGTNASYTYDFTKDESWTTMRFSLAVTAYSSAGNSSIKWGCTIDTDPTVHAGIPIHYFHPSDVRSQHNEVINVGGLRAGKHYLTLQWKATSGHVDGNDWVQIEASEVFL